MPRSANPKSQLGENGPESSELLPEMADNNPLTTETVDLENPVTQETPAPISAPAAAVADVSADNNSDPSASVLTPAERKLADRMTRDIARHLGLTGSSRSVRIR